ncbi:class II fructose-bisphosphate aldolase [Pseudonocardia spinosispora]|uniref:class II fructose-bisphosphate aldolase n=1 Tax=Pseudonocardia spinosispora TaxID=103441 RepID=UPI000407C24A|nr:class II fructose-bisphosphate aldolase [Pseudonocardia spinosispora]
MPLVPTGELVAAARASGHGVAAFNVITLEHAEGIVAGAEEAGAAVILQISENAVRYHGGRLLPIAAATSAVAREASVPVALHLDHVEDVELLYRAPEAGAGSVMFDASKLDYAANLAATRKAADWAHDHGLWLEAELGEVGGKDGAHAPGVRTDPGAAAEFVAATGVDALAVAVGSSHAMTSRTARLDQALISALRSAVDVPLVLHGSSGVPDEELRLAVAGGIVKVNIGTALNVAFTGGVREYLAEHAEVSDPRKYLAPGRVALAAVVRAMVGVVG